MTFPEPSAHSDLQALYRSHHGWLHLWLWKKIGNSFDAADLAHDTFVRLLTRPALPTLGSVSEARAYLRTIGSGLCIDLWRRREVEQAWLETLACHGESLGPSQEHQAIVVETLLEVSRMLGRLPRKAATAFVLSQVDGLTYREIAEHLQVSERMVKKYMAQAMLQCALMEAGIGS